MPWDRARKTERQRELRALRRAADPEGERERMRAQGRAWRAAHPHHYRFAAAANRLRKYALTDTEFEALVDRQEGRCAICQRVPDGPLAIDHDHATGRVRGLLCRMCNLGIGHLRDDPALLRAALSYLESSS